MAKQTDEPKDHKPETPANESPTTNGHCGIIMPISDTPGYDPGHWLEVRGLIIRAAKEAKYTAGMVSENDGQDVIHRSIVKNIYHNELVVCDVSSMNPNVMLELGLRMANKKPLIVIFDGEGAYPFDIKNMLYIPYPKGLRHSKVEVFVEALTERILQVTEAQKLGKYEPFLNHFNDVVIEESRLGTTTQSMAETLANLVDEVKSMKVEVRSSYEDGKLPSNNLKKHSRSSIFLSSELSFIYSVAQRMYQQNLGLSFETNVDEIWAELLSLTLDVTSLFYNKTLAEKLNEYKTTAKNLIANQLRNMGAIQFS